MVLNWEKKSRILSLWIALSLPLMLFAQSPIQTFWALNGNNGCRNVSFALTIPASTTYNAAGVTGANNIVDNGTLSVGCGNATGYTFNGTISGTGNLVKIGTGTQTVANSITYTGNTTVNNGTLVIRGGNSASTFIVNSGGTLNVNADGYSNSWYLGTNPGNTNNATINTGGTVNVNTMAAGSNGSINVGINGGTGVLTINSGATLNVVGRILVGANVATSNGTVNINGTVVLGTAGNYIGNNVDPGNGILWVGSVGAPAVVNINAGGSIYLYQFWGGDNWNNTGLFASNIINLNGGVIYAVANNPNFMPTRVATFNVNNNGATTFNTNGFNVGILCPLQHGTGNPDSGIIKAGAGALILSGASTYTGGTMVNGGTLTCSNSKAVGTGNVILNNGATMTWTVAPANPAALQTITVNVGATLNKGGFTFPANVQIINAGGTVNP